MLVEMRSSDLGLTFLGLSGCLYKASEERLGTWQVNILYSFMDFILYVNICIL